MDANELVKFLLALFIVSSPLLLALSGLWIWTERRARRALELRFKDVLDIDAELRRLDAQVISKRSKIDEIRTDYKEKREIYDRLLKEVAIFDERLAFAEMGVYEPHFDFTDSGAYKIAISEIREAQRSMVSAKGAVICEAEWTVDGSRSKGKTMTGRNIKLALRAFNGECDSAIANARWNNVNAMEKRIIRAQEQIDKLNASNQTYITQEYLNSKLKELYLAHEYRERLKEEREERAEAARQTREEQKLMRDMEKAKEEEEYFEKLLAKARAEATGIDGHRLESFTEQIKILERDLAQAQAKVTRAQAMAEKTRSGYVYIVSNVGSFGPDVVKIGLTRRLDPSDRVRELGGASVPFIFDTHAMIYSDDAPKLEAALHNEFEDLRVNVRNQRKEFFRVSIDAVEDAVGRVAPDAAFFRDIEAQEYRETLSRRQDLLEQADGQGNTPFPEAI